MLLNSKERPRANKNLSLNSFKRKCDVLKIFKVLETSWTDLEQRLKEAKDLGSVVIAHDYYLEQVSTIVLSVIHISLNTF